MLRLLFICCPTAASKPTYIQATMNCHKIKVRSYSIQYPMHLEKKSKWTNIVTNLNCHIHSYSTVQRENYARQNFCEVSIFYPAVIHS